MPGLVERSLNQLCRVSRRDCPSRLARVRKSYDSKPIPVRVDTALPQTSVVLHELIHLLMRIRTVAHPITGLPAQASNHTHPKPLDNSLMEGPALPGQRLEVSKFGPVCRTQKDHLARRYFSRVASNSLKQVQHSPLHRAIAPPGPPPRFVSLGRPIVRMMTKDVVDVPGHREGPLDAACGIQSKYVQIRWRFECASA